MEPTFSSSENSLPVTKQPWWKAKSIIALLFVGFLFVVALITAWLLFSITKNSSSVNPTPTPTHSIPTPTASSTTQPSPTPTEISNIALKVYFSKHPDSDSDFDAVFAVDRVSVNSGVAKFAFKALLDGPTDAEKAQNLFTSWLLSGQSDCGADGFTVTINGDKATVRLCRDYSSSGVGQDARAQAEGDATLKQFSNIKDVVYLNKSGNCLFDLSGQNLCLK